MRQCHHRFMLRYAVVLCGLVPMIQQRAAAQSPLHDELRARVESLRTVGAVRTAGVSLPASQLLAETYERRGFEPVWQDDARVAALAAALDGLQADGLDPAHYFAAAVRRSRSDTSIRGRADAELLCTHALLLAAQHLRYGAVETNGTVPRRSLDAPALDAGTVDRLLAADPGRALEAMRPSHFTYHGLTAALAWLRSIERAGDVPRLRAVTLARDSGGPDVLALRQRLRLEGDLPAAADTASDRFDAGLETAVRSYQHRHALNPDGVVGPATLRELNMPIATRIDQIRVNLERARWVTHDLAHTFVAVNVAGAHVYFVRGGTVEFESRAIVGRTATRTPVFSATMRYIELNPTWTVPPGIVAEVLGQIRRNPSWLAGQRMRVIDAAGRPIDPTRIDFGRYTARTFPYVFRQEPGPLNPLGAIKLMFPNSHNVYLHDTPARDLFEREERLFSHGCIRVQDPIRLAELVLDAPAWPADSIRAAIATGRTRTVTLPRPIPVLVLYWTASTDLHGELHFYRDVYSRDAQVLRALDGS